jgi:hypothetical protein
METNMSNMEITFYRALIGVGVSEELAQAVVEAMEKHMAEKIKEANRALEFRTNVVIVITTISAAIGGYLAIIAK